MMADDDGIRTTADAAPISTPYTRSAAIATALLVLVVVAVTLDSNAGASGRIVKGVGIAYLLSALVLVLTVRPIQGTRRIAAALLGTGTAWMMAWYAIGYIMGGITEDPSVYDLAEAFTLCALATGTIFGLLGYVKPSLVDSDWKGTIVSCGAALGLLAALMGCHLLLARFQRGDAVVQSTHFAWLFVMPAALTGTIWAGVVRTRAPGASPRAWFGIASLVLTLLAAGVELWVGWADAHRFTLHPVGHLGFLVLPAWAVAFLWGVAALIVTRRRPYPALLSLGICTGAIALLFTE